MMASLEPVSRSSPGVDIAVLVPYDHYDSRMTEL